MSKTQKELAFLRDLYIEPDWTQRYTDVFDENFKFSGGEKFLYLNAGTGSHALALREKLDDETEILGISEDEELLKIARAKADATQANVDFSKVFPAQKFDAVLADASFVRPADLTEFINQIVDVSSKQMMFFLPTAGSFGEVFSLLWETLLNADMLEKSTEIERLIAEIPTISGIEQLAKNANLTKVKTVTKSEFFEFDSGREFLESPLIADFLMPVWLEFLSEPERLKVAENLALTIDEDCHEMSFRFSIKATLVTGEKAKK